MNPKTNPKLKRILAWIGIILLVAMYVMTLVFALLGKEYAKQMVLASVSMTIIIPVLIYAMQMAFSIVSGKKDGNLPDSREGSEPESEDSNALGSEADGFTESEEETNE